MTKSTELREMDPDELGNKLTDARQELFNLRFQHVTGQLDNYARIGDVRRDIARMNTILREKEIEAAEGTDDGTQELGGTQVPGTDDPGRDGPDGQEPGNAARRARVLGSRRAAARAAREAAEQQEGREDA